MVINIKVILKIISIVLVCLLLCSNFIYASTNNETYIKSYTEKESTLKQDIKLGEVDVTKSVKYNKNGEFNISLLAQSLNFKKEKVKDKIYNIVFAIDNSGSMYGTSGRIQACVDAINTVIKDLAEHENVNISVIAYSSGSKIDYSQDGSEDLYYCPNNEKAKTLLPLAHYDSNAYIGYVDNFGDGSGKDIQKRNGMRWIYSSTGEKIYSGNTNTQAGIIKSYEVLNNATNKDIATPVIILMSDGEATDYAYSTEPFSDYKYELNSISEIENLKAGSTDQFDNNQLPAFNAILSANYIKNQLNQTYKNQCLIYSLGYSLNQTSDTYSYCIATLNPNTSNINLLKSYMENGYEKYGLYNLLNTSEISNQFKEKYNLKNLEYCDGYYEGNTSNLKSIYQKIVNEVIIEYIDTMAIKENTDLTIIDTLGNDFILNETSNKIKMQIKIDEQNEYEIELEKIDDENFNYSNENFEVNYNKTNLQVNSKIRSNYIANKKIKLNYNTSINEEILKKVDGSTYYTNDITKTKYIFEPNVENPIYSENKVEKNIDITGSLTLKTAANVIVNHKDEKGNILAQEEIKGYVDDNYYTQSKEFDEYELKETPENAEGIMAKDTIYVTYIYEKIYGNITIEKIDKNNNDIRLENVEFCIYDSNNNQKYKSITDKNGIVKFSNLEVGKYTIKETKTIEGYSLLKDKIEIEINKDNRDVNLQIENEQKTILPLAGGENKIKIVCLGVSIVVLSVLVGYKFIKKKEEKS